MAEPPSRGRQSHLTKSGTCRLCGVCSGARKRCRARSSFFTALGSRACLLCLREEQHAALLPQDPRDPARGGRAQLPPPEPRAPATPSAPQDLPVTLPHEPVVTGLVSQYGGASVTQPWTRAREGAAATPPTALPSSAQRQDLNAPDKHRNAGRGRFFKSYS